MFICTIVVVWLRLYLGKARLTPPSHPTPAPQWRDSRLGRCPPQHPRRAPPQGKYAPCRWILVCTCVYLDITSTLLHSPDATPSHPPTPTTSNRRASNPAAPRRPRPAPRAARTTKLVRFVRVYMCRLSVYPSHSFLPFTPVSSIHHIDAPTNHTGRPSPRPSRLSVALSCRVLSDHGA